MKQLLFLLMLVPLLFTCEPLPTNFNPDELDFLKPSFSMITDRSDFWDGDTVGTDSVQLSLKGNILSRDTTLMRWSLDEQEWTNWVRGEKNVFDLLFVGLPEGEHTLTISVCYDPEGESLDSTITFFRAIKPSVAAVEKSRLSVDVLSPCTLSVNAEGTGDIRYVWYHNGTALESETASILILDSVLIADTGSYYCEVSNTWGKTSSEPVAVKALLRVVYAANGSTEGAVPVDSNKYDPGASTKVLENSGNLTRYGYMFAGWTTNPEESDTALKSGADVTLNGGLVTLYAKWIPILRTLSFNSNGATEGGVPASMQLMAGEKIAVPGNSGSLVNPGKTFLQWNTAVDGSGTSYGERDELEMIEGDVTLYAQWTIHATYTVTYQGNGAQSGEVPVDAKRYVEGATVTIAGNSGKLEKAGNTFTGWNSEMQPEDVVAYTPGATFVMRAASITFFAAWTSKPTYTLTYLGGNSTTGTAPDPVSNITGTAVAVAGKKTLLLKGHTFAGWNTATGGDGESYEPNSRYTVGEADDTLYAQWKPATYTLAYNGNGSDEGDVPGATEHAFGTEVVVSAAGNLSRSGHSFDGWNTGADSAPGDTFAAGAPLTIPDSNVTLYACWRVNRYTITYHGNDNTGGADPDSVTTGYHELVVLAGQGTLERRGYTFIGWNTQADGAGGEYPAETTMPMGAQNVDLYAKWTPAPFTVTFVKNDEGATGEMAAQTIVFDSEASLGEIGFELSGKAFAGWSTSADGEVEYGDKAVYKMGAQNDTLYAQWSDDYHTVTFDKNDEGATGEMTAQNIPSNRAASLSANTFEKVGSELDGWSLSTNGEVVYEDEAPFHMGTENDTLYAIWTKNSYKLSYNGNGFTGGNVQDTAVVPYGDVVTVALQGNLVRTGHTFAGWNTAQDGSGTSRGAGLEITMGAASVTLYAQWTKNSYKLSYDGNGFTSGTVPDSAEIPYGDAVTVALQGDLVRSGHTFTGWNTRADGRGTSWAPGSQPAMGAAAVKLYAQWNSIPLLTALTVSTGGVNLLSGFSGTTTGYRVSVPYETSLLSIVPTADAPAQITINGTTLIASGAAFNTAFSSDAATYTISVTPSGAATGTTYTVSVTRQTAAGITTLTISNSTNGYSSPASRSGSVFSSAVPYGFTTVSVSPSLMDPESHFFLEGTEIPHESSLAISLTAGENTFPLSVTAADGITTTGYSLIIVRQGGSNSLAAAIAASAGTLSPSFLPEVKNYTLTLPAGDETVTIAVTTEDAAATFSIGESTPQNSGSLVVPVSELEIIGVTVISPDLSSTNDYTINVNRSSYLLDISRVGAGGVVSPAGSTSVAAGANQTVAFTNAGGYSLNGFTVDGIAQPLASSYTFTNVQKSHSLVATFTLLPTSTITYSTNHETSGDLPALQMKSQGVDLVLATNSGDLVRTGYGFVGWNTAAAGNGTDYAEGAIYTTDSNLTLFPRWSAQPYNVTFDGNGSGQGSMVPLSVVFGTSKNLNANVFSRNGFSFAGWSTSAGGAVVYADEASFTMNTEGDTLYAVWNYIMPAVTFSASNGEGLESVLNTTINVSLSFPMAIGQTGTVQCRASLSGTANSGADYSPFVTTLLSFDAEHNSRTVQITIINDAEYSEGDETVVIELVNPDNLVPGTNTTYTYTIIDNDIGPTAYVSQGSTAPYTGASWKHAFRYLQDALTAAIVSDGTIVKIHVAEGTYYPDETNDNPQGTNDRVSTFRMVDNVSLYGGFPAGGGERNPDPLTNRTVLSGNIDHEYGTDDPDGNALHVVTAANGVIDGFTVTGGYADEYDEGIVHGGGLIVYGSLTLTVNNCWFLRNSAINGGGAYISGSAVTFDNCTFEDNSGDYSHDSYGAGLCIFDFDNQLVAKVTIHNSRFLHNHMGENAMYAGGAIYSNGNSLTISNSVFDNNTANTGAGAIASGGVSLQITQCDFNNNACGSEGGAINIRDAFGSGNKSIIDECTFSSNTASGGGALCYDECSGTHTVKNTAFIDNSAEGGGAVSLIYAGRGNGVPVTIDNCKFNGNKTIPNVYGSGGALSSQSSAITVRGCYFNNNACNSESYGGGAITITGQYSFTEVDKCMLTLNTAVYGGGALYYHNLGGTNVIRNTIVFENTASLGGAVYMNGAAPIRWGGDPVSFVNCTFSKNRATNSTQGGGAFYISDNYEGSRAEITNSILWFNISENSTASYPDIYYAGNYAPSVSYCDIQQSGYNNENSNISAYPQFSSESPDSYMELKLMENSPCINAGNVEFAPPDDIEGKLRDGKPDMGAYEY